MAGNPYHGADGKFTSREKATGAFIDNNDVSLEEYERVVREAKEANTEYVEYTDVNGQKHRLSTGKRTRGNKPMYSLQQRDWSAGCTVKPDPPPAPLFAMATQEKCPRCGAVLKPNGKCPKCGWPKKRSSADNGRFCSRDHDSGQFCSRPRGERDMGNTVPNVRMKKVENPQTRENREFVYVGVFINKDELRRACRGINRTPLEKEIDSPHVTFGFRPETIDESLLGETVTVTVNGYGVNAENEGVSVELHSDNPKLQAEFEKIEVPHITLSVSKEGKAVNTRYLDFKPVKPFSFTMTYGGFLKKPKRKR